MSKSKYIDFNFDDMLVKIAVPAKYMGWQDKNKTGYTNIEPDKNAIINELNTFINGQGIDDFSGTIYHNTVMGFGNSYIELEGDLDLNESYDLYKIAATYNIKGLEFMIGKGKYLSEKSSASIFDYTSPYEKKMVQLSTSNNLRELDKSSYKSIYFDTSSKGIVRGYRDGRIIFTKVVNAGTNKISYTDLPKGNYDLRLEIEQDNSNKETKEFKIFNNSSSSDLNENNYTVSFNEVDVVDSDSKETYIDLSYVKAVNNSSMILGSSVKLSEDEALIGLGYEDILLNNLLNVSLYFEIGDDAKFTNVDVNYDNLTFSWVEQKYSNFDDCNNLFCSLYGYDDLNEMSINYSNYLFGNKAYIFYKVTDRKNNNDNTNLKYSTLSASYNVNIYKNIFAEFYYRNKRDLAHHNSSVDDDVIGVSFDIPINEKLYTSNVIEKNSDNVLISSSLNYSDTLDSVKELQLTGSIGSTFTSSDSNLKHYENIGLSYNSNKMNSSLYVNDYDGNITTSATLSTNIISDYNSVFLSNERDDSYIIVNTDTNSDEKLDLGNITVRKNNVTSFSRDLTDEPLVIGLNSFDKYDYSIDVESSGFTAFDPNYLGSVFSYTGTVSMVNNSMTKVKTFLTFFESFSGNELANVECTGNGCSEVTEVGEGVYSVSVVENVPFKIIADGDICLINNETYQRNNGKSYCFPKIKELENGMQLVVDNKDSEYDIYYIGVVEDNLPAEFMSIVKNSNIKLIERKFGTSDRYLFAKVEKDIKLNYDPFNKIKQLANYNNGFKNTESLVNIYE